VFGLGVTLVATPVTATVLATVSDSHSGIASGVNNAVARIANLLAVATLPLIAGLTGRHFYDPSAMTHGFHVAMVVSAGLAVTGAVVAWLKIDNSVLASEARPEAAAEAAPNDFSCAVAGPPLRTRQA
jgi:MFS family permease